MYLYNTPTAYDILTNVIGKGFHENRQWEFFISIDYGVIVPTSQTIPHIPDINVRHYTTGKRFKFTALTRRMLSNSSDK